jgi:ABC-type dipeptide/oligopeptide/nickel transport system permease component
MINRIIKIAIGQIVEKIIPGISLINRIAQKKNTASAKVSKILATTKVAMPSPVVLLLTFFSKYTYDSSPVRAGRRLFIMLWTHSI